MKVDEMVIRDLSYQLRTYDATIKLITASKNRLQAMIPEADPNHQTGIQGFESEKNKISRYIEKLLDFWPLWSEWMKDIPGCGPFIAGNLIMLYYYRFVPICKKCKADLVDFECPECKSKAAGAGVLEYRIEEKDFEDVSSWWHYLGRHNAPIHTVKGCNAVVKGKSGEWYCPKCKKDVPDDEVITKMPKRTTGSDNKWSSLGRVVTYQLADQFNRQKPEHFYKAFLLKRKKKRETTHPKASKGHRLNMAKNESVKLFLAHFWTVARTIDEKPLSKPYAGTIMGHTNIIDPFYWKDAA